MNFNKIYNLVNTKLKIEIPITWEIQQEENLISIFHSKNGFGALQLSVYYVAKIDTVDCTTELSEYLEGKIDHAEIETYNDYAYSKYNDESSTYWRFWVFKKGNYVIFASYNCSTGDAGKENGVVDEVLNSIST